MLNSLLNKEKKNSELVTFKLKCYLFCKIIKNYL